MCSRCHAETARRAQRRLAVLCLQRDCAIDDGLVPGALLLAEIDVQRSNLVTAKQALLPLAITPLGELVRPITL